MHEADLEKVLTKIELFPEEMLGYGTPPNEWAISTARRIVRKLHRPPAIIPMADGGIHLEYAEFWGTTICSLTIDNDGGMCFVTGDVHRGTSRYYEVRSVWLAAWLLTAPDWLRPLLLLFAKEG